MSAQRRVVVTGVGLVTPLAIGTEETWKQLLAGASGIGPISLFDAAPFAARIAGEVKGFDPQVWVDKKDVKKMDRFIQFAIAASDIASKDARLEFSAALPQTGSTSGPGPAMSRGR